MSYVFDPPKQAALPIKGSDKLFPVHRIYCIGRNYAEHAREMGHDPNKEPPFFFQKNPNNLRTDGQFPYPSGTKDVHFEIEMIVALKSGGVDIKAEDALRHVWGYGIGLVRNVPERLKPRTIAIGDKNLSSEPKQIPAQIPAA